MKEKILIVGLPRSGTTIISNTINSLEKAFCFIEPHWEYELYGKVLFDDKKLKWIFGLKYNPNLALPLNSAIEKIFTKNDLVGFKETFRSNVYKNIDSKIPNEDLIKNYRDAGYKIIPIIRNPLNVWNSVKSFKPNPNSWGGKLDLFLQSYCDFLDFISPLDPIVFEKFVTAPEKTLQSFGLDVPDKIRLKSRKINMGDEKAKDSTKIEYKKKKIVYTQEEEATIQDSNAMKQYKQYFSE